ncbi:MAG: hypothetical protein JKY43_00065 [Phycisphaerales bacterium]|nr:hypothetical protein [Phycisphaerales bacterium]
MYAEGAEVAEDVEKRRVGFGRRKIEGEKRGEGYRGEEGKMKKGSGRE